MRSLSGFEISICHGLLLQVLTRSREKNRQVPAVVLVNPNRGKVKISFHSKSKFCADFRLLFILVVTSSTSVAPSMSAGRVEFGQKGKGRLPDLNDDDSASAPCSSQSQSPPPSPPAKFNLDLIWPITVPRSMLTSRSETGIDINENAGASSSKLWLSSSPGKNQELNLDMLKPSTFLGAIDLTTTSDVSECKNPQVHQDFPEVIDLTDSASDDEGQLFRDLEVVDATRRNLKRKHIAAFGDIIDIHD